MPTDRLTIDMSTVSDNRKAQLVEFTAEIDDDEYDFAVQYGVLEALSGDAPDDDAEELFIRVSDEIAEAALVSLRRDPDVNIIMVSENDLE